MKVKKINCLLITRKDYIWVKTYFAHCLILMSNSDLIFAFGNVLKIIELLIYVKNGINGFIPQNMPL